MGQLPRYHHAQSSNHRPPAQTNTQRAGNHGENQMYRKSITAYTSSQALQFCLMHNEAAQDKVCDAEVGRAFNSAIASQIP